MKINKLGYLVLVVVVSALSAVGTQLYIEKTGLPSLAVWSSSEPSISEQAPMTPSTIESGFERKVDIKSIRDLNEALVAISESVRPSVVTVFTEKVFKIRRSNPFMSPFFSDPFLERFFGRQPQGGRERDDDSNFEERRQQGMGSGVIVSSDGYILTNNHVISEADEIRVRTLDNRTLIAKVIGTDPQTDVAVIKVDAKDLKPVVQGNSDKLRVGEIVLAVGSPMSANLAHTVTQGIVSAKGRSNVGLAEYEDFIQTDAGINPGNSGGALVNLDGELVGINTAIASRSGGSEGIGFAVPINMAHLVMEALITKGEVVRSWLGVQAQDMTDELARAMSIKPQDGVLIAGIQDGSPAKKAGLQAGDVIYQINGDKIDSAAQLRNKIAVMSPGSKIKLSFLRDAKQRDLEFALEKLPSPEGATKVSTKETQEVSKLLGFQVSNLSP